MARFSLTFRRTLLIILVIVLAEGLFVLLLQGTGGSGFFQWAGRDGGDSAGTGAAFSENGSLMPGEVNATPPPPPPRSYLPEDIRTIRPDAPQASEQERAQANEILLHANRTFSQVRGTYDAYVAALLQLTDVYEQRYTAPVPPERPARASLSSALAPPENLWTPADIRLFKDGLEGMDAAMDSMRADYLALMRYVADDSVRDDGVRGKGLTKAIRRSGEAYGQARDKVLSGLDSEADKAERILLQGHPLRPQIMAAKLLTARMRLAPAMLAGNKPDPQVLERWRKELEGMINEAAMLPCAVPGDVERLWRVFLRTAAEFPQVIALGQKAGFDDLLRGQINTTYARVQQAYNDFVAAVNTRG